VLKKTLVLIVTNIILFFSLHRYGLLFK
jgi:hypothetical protein